MAQLPLTCYVMNLFLFARYIGIAHLVPGFLSQGNVPCIAVDLVCPWAKQCSGASRIATLDQNLSHLSGAEHEGHIQRQHVAHGKP